MQDWEREQADDMFRQQAMDYMSERTWHMKNEEARQRMEGFNGGDGGVLDTLFGIGVVLFVVGFLVYAAFTSIFGG